MSFCTLSGLDVEIADPNAKGSLLEIGERSRAFNGTLRTSRQTTKRVWELKTTPMTYADALAFTGLIQGEGHVWDFQTLFSSKGLPTTSTSGTVTVGTPGTPKYGGALTVSGASAASSVVWTPGIVTDWTVAVWRSTDNGATWNRHIVRSDGSKWLNGSTSVAATAWLTVSGSTVTIADTTVTAVRYDDLIIYPFKVLDSWATGALSTAVTAWPAAPVLTLAGDLVGSASGSVQGQVTGLEYMRGVLSGTAANNLQVLSFTLSEV